MRTLVLKKAGKMLATFATLCTGAALAATPAAAEEPNPIGQNQRVLVIPVKFRNRPMTRRTAQQWIDTLNGEVNTFFRRATNGKTSFIFERPTGAGMPADGWTTLDVDQDQWPGTLDGGRLAIWKVQRWVNMARYNRVLVITNAVDNRNMPAFGAQSVGSNWAPVMSGSEGFMFPPQALNLPAALPVFARYVGICAGNEWVFQASPGGISDAGAATLSHEMGHQLGLYTHYGNVSFGSLLRDTVGPWDIMGYSPNYSHFLAAPKAERGFLDPGRVVAVGPPTAANINTDVWLNPQELTLTGGNQVLRIPFTNDPRLPFTGYTVEYRKRVNGDEVLPSEGVLVSFTDQNPSTPFKNIVMPSVSAPANGDRPTLLPGETYTDTARGISIQYVGNSSTSALIRMRYNLLPANVPNVGIRPWTAPPYETPDIWIDSERNGWGTYRFAEADGTPIGNGDDAWVDHVNRVYVRVFNRSNQLVTNVRVNLYQNDPPGLGDAGPNWNLLGTLILPSIAANSSAVGFLPWNPTVGRHTCIRAVIERLPGETITSDNIAQENIANFDTTSDRTTGRGLGFLDGGAATQPFAPVTLYHSVHNYGKADINAYIRVSNLPKGWSFQAEAERILVPKDTTKRVGVRIFPTDPALDPQAQAGRVFRVMVEALVEQEDTLVSIGGTEQWVHLTHKDDLTCNYADNTQNGVTCFGKLSALQPTLAPLAKQRIGIDILSAVPNSGFAPRTVFATTDSNGAYKVRFDKLPKGKYLLRASWSGNMLYEMKDAQSAAFSIP